MPDRSGNLHDLARRWGLPALLALAAIAIELGGDAARQALRYEREAVLAGEWWRLATGNLAHLGPRHLALNLVGLALVVALDGRTLRGWRGAALVVFAMLGVGGGLLAFAPALSWYVGLSGALHGLLVAIAIEACVDRSMRRWGAALVSALVLKLAWEQLVGPVPFTADAAGGPVVVVAHLHGAIAGAVVAALLVWRDRREASRAARV